MKLILFDIDGTLLSTNQAAKRAFRRTLLSVYNETGPIDTHSFDGKTDPQIARELLRLAGMPDASIEAGFARFWPAYVASLEQELSEPHTRLTVYPGVPELLERLFAAQNDAVVGLLTGNVEAAATLKITAAGLANQFRVGAFGSDAEARNELPAIAVARARELTGSDF